MCLLMLVGCTWKWLGGNALVACAGGLVGYGLAEGMNVGCLLLRLIWGSEWKLCLCFAGFCGAR